MYSQELQSDIVNIALKLIAFDAQSEADQIDTCPNDGVRLEVGLP